MTTAPANGAELADVVGEHGIDEKAQAAIRAYVAQAMEENGAKIQDALNAGFALG